MIKLFTAFCLTALLAGCNNDTNDATIEDRLTGTWLQECNNGNGFSAIYEFSEIELTVTTTEYPNADCSGDSVSTTTISAVYAIGETLVLADGNTVYEMNFIANLEGAIEVEEILFLEGDRLYNGVETEDRSRPTEIDFVNFLVKISP